MKKVKKIICIPFIIVCITSILFIYHLSCISGTFQGDNSVFILTILAFITVIIGIFTDPTYIIRESLINKKK